MDTKDWAWAVTHGDDSEYWQEEAEIQAWIEAGAPPVEEWEAEKRAEKPKPIPTGPTGVAVPERALTVSHAVAAELLSVSADTFKRHVLPHVRVVQIGRRQMIPVMELQEYVNRNAARALDKD
jgi:hypothetical protein